MTNHRSKRPLAILACMAAVLLLASCHNKREEIETVDTKPIQETIDQNKPQPVKDTVPTPPPFHYMSGTFTAEAQGIKCTGQVRACCDSVIWLTASKVIELGRAMLTPDSVLVYAKVNNSYFRTDYKYLKKRFNIDINFKTVQNMLLEQSKNSSTPLTFPVRTSKYKTDIKVRLTRVEKPTTLTFPFSIPARADKMSMSMFD